MWNNSIECETNIFTNSYVYVKTMWYFKKTMWETDDVNQNVLQINALIEVNLYSLSLYCETSNLIDAVWLSTLYQLVKFVDKCLTEIIYVQAQNTEKFKFEPRRLFFWTLKPISLLVFLLQMETSTVQLTWFKALISTAKGYRNRLGIGDGNNNELIQ